MIQVDSSMRKRTPHAHLTVWEWPASPTIGGMRPVAVLALLLASSAAAQAGLGVARSLTPADEGVRGNVVQVVERVYDGEGLVLSRAELLGSSPWLTRTLDYREGRLVRQEIMGGRTDGVAGLGVTTYAYAGGCLRRVRFEDLSTRDGRRLTDAEKRDEILTPGTRCRPDEALERLFGKPALRKAYVWNGDRVKVTAFRKDNSAAYQLVSTCLSPAAACEETLTYGKDPAIREVTRLTRTSAGLPVRRQETRFVDGERQHDSVYTYNSRGWLTSSAFLNGKTGAIAVRQVFKYPATDAQGNWTARETFRVEHVFGKEQLGLIGYVTRQLRYRAVP